MPRSKTREVPRWKRGKAKKPGAPPVQLRGRSAREFAREFAKATQPQAGGAATPASGTITRTGAWRFRRHLPPFGWLAALIASAGLHSAPHPLLWGLLASLAAPAVMVLFTRHLQDFTRRAVDVAALITSLWVPFLAARGLHSCIAWLLLTWAPCCALWVRHYRWHPDAAAAVAIPVAGDHEQWNALAAQQKWNATLGSAEQLPGGGRRYPIQCDGIKTVLKNILSSSENVAGAWHKPMTEAYAERHPHGVTSRGYLTILGSETLMRGREWNGAGMDPKTGLAVIGRYADGSPAHVKMYTPRYGVRHALLSGTTGSGKSTLLDLLCFIAITTGWFVPVVLDPQEGQSLPFWRDRCLYAAGTDECYGMLRGLHAGMLDRSRYLASLRWDDDGVSMRGMPFFDYEMTGLPMPLIILDEAHMVLKGKTKTERDIVEKVMEVGRLGRKTGTALWLATQLPSLKDLGGEQALRDMLRGGNVISMRTANKVASGMLGLEKDPSEIPPYFTNGKETYGLGYTAGPDARPDAPMRSDLVPKSMLKKVPAIPQLDDRFREAMDLAMGGMPLVTAAPVLSSRPASAAAPPVDDAPEGRRCADAVWKALCEAGRPLERGEVIARANHVATGEWGRDRGFSIRAVGEALRDLAAGKYPDRPIAKPGDGVYESLAPRGVGA